MNDITKNTAKNTIFLYCLTFAKLVFPLLTLPYLTRVLSSEQYGFVAYVKSFMSYMQIIIDFGFILSAVKDIVNATSNNQKIGEITGQIIIAKIGLAFLILFITLCCSFCIPILKKNQLYTILYVISIMITAFSTEYLFRGIEKMQIITVIFVVAKAVVVCLTFLFVKNDNDLLLIPIMEIAGNALSCVFTWIFIKRMHIQIVFKHWKKSWKKLKDSAVYFFSSFSTTAFTALNTLLIGIVVDDLTQVAFWSVAWQLISAVLSLYSPIIDGVYPQMIQKKDLAFIRKMLALFIPIIVAGCTVCFFSAEWILTIFAGKIYTKASLIFRLLIPLLFFSFPSMLFGWPALGCVKKEKLVTFSTFCGALCQVIGLTILIVSNRFSIYSVAILRVFTEIVIMAFRMSFLIKNRKLFNKG